MALAVFDVSIPELDGVVSGAGITIGVAVANPTNLPEIMLAGVAGLLAGVSAMAMGEYVSVSSQRDTEEVLIARERHDLRPQPARGVRDACQEANPAPRRARRRRAEWLYQARLPDASFRN